MKARISSFRLVLLKEVPHGNDELFMDFINLVNCRMGNLIDFNRFTHDHMHGFWEGEWCAKSTPEDNRSKFNCSSDLDKQFTTRPPPLVCIALLRPA